MYTCACVCVCVCATVITSFRSNLALADSLHQCRHCKTLHIIHIPTLEVSVLGFTSPNKNNNRQIFLDFSLLRYKHSRTSFLLVLFQESLQIHQYLQLQQHEIHLLEQTILLILVPPFWTMATMCIRLLSYFYVIPSLPYIHTMPCCASLSTTFSHDSVYGALMWFINHNQWERSRSPKMCGTH